MANLDFSVLTPDNGAIRNVAELIMLDAVQGEDLTALHTIVTGVATGQKAAGVGEFDALGVKAGASCAVDFTDTPINTVEKTWALGDWIAAESICYDDLKATLADYARQERKSMADVTGTEYMEKIILPRMELAIRKMFIRLAWFGDTGADNIADGGSITNGVNVNLFSVTDGFFKQLAALVAADPSKRVTIAANAQSTYAAQKSAINTSGVAMGIFDELMLSASNKLMSADDKAIYVTRSLADALAMDIRRNNAGSDLQWESVFNGVEMTHYNGVRVYKMMVWDELINAFNNSGTKWIDPYRAVFTTPRNLLIGTSNTELIENLQVWFDPNTQTNRILASDNIGAVLLDDEMAVYAI